MDDYTRSLELEHRTALWVAELSDGRQVYMDDGRPGCEPSSAWLRLKSTCESSGLHVRKLWLRFRSNIQECLPENADGYFFCKSAIGMLNASETLLFYKVGALENGVLTVQTWRVPELILVEVEERDAKTLEELLIVKRLEEGTDRHRLPSE